MTQMKTNTAADELHVNAAPASPSAASMCERKTGQLEQEGYVKTGYVLRQLGMEREVAVSDGGAVSWFTLEQWNWLMFNRDHVEFQWPKPVGVRLAPDAAPEVQAKHEGAGDARATQAEQDAREIAVIWDGAKAEAAMYVEAHCVDGEVHAKHIMAQPRPKITPPLPKTGITAADVTRAQCDLARYAASGDAELAAACARSQAVIEGLLSGLHVEQLL